MEDNVSGVRGLTMWRDGWIHVMYQVVKVRDGLEIEKGVRDDCHIIDLSIMDTGVCLLKCKDE